MVRKVAITLCFVAAASLGDSVRLAWDANPELDLAGYRVHYGPASRLYTNQVDVGNVTQTTVSNLYFGTLYYFAVTAYNVSQATSDFSNEISWLVPGRKPTRISSIMISH